MKYNKTANVLLLIFITKCIDINCSARIESPDNNLINATIIGDIELAKKAIAQGASINTTGIYGNTPLHSAVINQKEKIVHYLLLQKADVSVKNNLKLTALHQAAMGKNDKILQMLLDAGADINEITYKRRNETPIKLAMPQSDQKILIKLLEYGAQIEFDIAQDGSIADSGRSYSVISRVFGNAFWQALKKQPLKVSISMQSIEKLDPTGTMTPLMLAAARGNILFVKSVINDASLKENIKEIIEKQGKEILNFVNKHNKTKELLFVLVEQFSKIIDPKANLIDIKNLPDRNSNLAMNISMTISLYIYNNLCDDYNEIINIIETELSKYEKIKKDTEGKLEIEDKKAVALKSANNNDENNGKSKTCIIL